MILKIIDKNDIFFKKFETSLNSIQEFKIKELLDIQFSLLQFELNLIKELNITKFPAICIEEKSIEFKDVIIQ